MVITMLFLAPIMYFGIACLIKGMTVKFITHAGAFAKCAAYSDQAVEAIRIVVAFGREELEIENYLRFLKSSDDIAVKTSVKASYAFGLMYFAIYFGYTYAFFIGAVWVDEGFYNHAYDRPYTSGDIISVFFGVLFGMVSLGGLGPNIVALAEAKAAGKRAFDVIDRNPGILIDDPEAVDHTMLGEIEFKNVDFHYPSR